MFSKNLIPNFQWPLFIETKTKNSKKFGFKDARNNFACLQSANEPLTPHFLKLFCPSFFSFSLYRCRHRWISLLWQPAFSQSWSTPDDAISKTITKRARQGQKRVCLPTILEFWLIDFKMGVNELEISLKGKDIREGDNGTRRPVNESKCHPLSYCLGNRRFQQKGKDTHLFICGIIEKALLFSFLYSKKERPHRSERDV